MLTASGGQTYDGRSVRVESHIAPDDSDQKTPRATLEPGLPRGIYVVDWRIHAAEGYAMRFGSYSLGVGMPAPAPSTDEGAGGLRERESQQRGKRAAHLGGALFILLAIILPSLPRRR